MSTDAALALLVVLLIANYWITRSVLYPPILFCAMWFFDLSLYRLNLTEINSLHPYTIAVVTAGAALFSLGGGLGLLVPGSLIRSRFVLTRFPPRNQLVKPLLLLFLSCGLPLLFASVLRMAGGGGGEGSLLAQARTNAVAGANQAAGPAGFSFLPYFSLWPIYAAFLFLIEKRDKAFWLMALVAFAAAVLTTGRVPILQLIAGLTCIHLMQTNRVRFWSALKVIRTPVLLFLGLYVGLIFVDKGSQASFYGNSVGEIVLVLFVSYVVGPTAALDYLFQHPQEYIPAPNYTFKFFLGIASHLHLLAFEGFPPLDVYVLVPNPVNVYTVYKSLFVDWGLAGALIAILIFGFLHTLVFRKAKTGSELGLYFLAILMLPAMMSIFADEYTAFGSYIDAFLFGALYFYFRSLSLRVLPRLRSGYGAVTTPGIVLKAE
jgi:oligosaccharide repeat unit polymerase